MTYLQLVNAVLQRLRESTVSTVADTAYSSLIGLFVNEAKRDVENAWNWSMLRTSYSVNTSDGVATYTLTGSNPNTRILDAWNTTNNSELVRLTNPAWINMQGAVVGTTSSSPIYWDRAAEDASTHEQKVRLWPTPNAVEALLFYAVTPQADFSSDSTEMKVPNEPVIQGAYLKAISERGEDGGNLSQIQQQLYQSVLSTAIAIDASNYEDELTWQAI